MNRRMFIALVGSMLAGCATDPIEFFSRSDFALARERKGWETFTIVDIHNHIFNASDLPIAGFLAHTAPLPEQTLRKLAEIFKRKVTAEAPSGEEELAQLDTFWDRTKPLGYPSLGETTQNVLDNSLAGIAGRLLDDPRAAQTVGRLGDALVMATHYRYQVAAEIVDTYQPVGLFTPAMVDFSYWSGRGREPETPETPLATQIRVQEKISRLSVLGLIGREDARIHPFVPFDPLREVRRRMDDMMLQNPTRQYAPYRPNEPYDPKRKYRCDAPLEPLTGAWKTRSVNPPINASALDFVRYAIEQAGFAGVKMYPPVGFLPLNNAQYGVHKENNLGVKLDLALRAFYAYCEAEQVPITTHANDSNAYALGYGRLAEPRMGWKAVLEEFPNLRLNLGHFGHTTGTEGDGGIKRCAAWMRQAAVLMEIYPNVYADVSNSPLPAEKEYAERYIKLLKELFEAYPIAKKRVMYGSNWWMNKLAPNHDLFVDAFVDRFEDAFGHTEAQALMGGNAFTFLGYQNEDGNRHRKRLIAFYDNQKIPKWLT